MNYQRLRDLRNDHDLSQKKLASVLGISQRVYSYYESGQHQIPIEILEELADYYHVSLDYITGRSNVNSRPLCS